MYSAVYPDNRMVRVLLFILLLNSFCYAGEFLPSSKIDSVDENDIERMSHGVFLDINSTYKGEVKNCGYVKFPEEDEVSFGLQGKYTELKKYYDLKREVPQLKKYRDPENDTEYKNRKRDYEASRNGTQMYFNELRESVLDSGLEIRSKRTKELLSDYIKFEKHILNIGVNGSPILINENPEISRTVRRMHSSYKKEIDDFHRTHDHYTAYAPGVLDRAKKARRSYPIKLDQLRTLEKDKEVQELVKDFSEEKVYDMYDAKRRFKRSKSLTIVFEGTGQYSPILERNMKVLQSSLGSKPSQEDIDKVNKKATTMSNDMGYFAKKNDIATWSGMIRGPIGKGLYANIPHEGVTRTSQWLYLPSENASGTAVTQNLFSKNNMVTRKESYSRGLECLKKYLQKYPDTDLNIIGHSSGVKAAIDFAKHIKDSGINNKVDMLGIDPVNDMIGSGIDGAVSGGLVSLISLAPGLLEECDGVDPDSNTDEWVGVIRSREQDELSKPSNARQFNVFYQTQDRIGLGDLGPITFGIHGSPVKGAVNKHIGFKEESNQHHGTITQQDKVIESFRSIISR